LFTTYKHGRAITIDMRYKIRLSVVQTTLWLTPALSYSAHSIYHTLN